MKSVLTLTALVCLAAASQATLINFDDLTAGTVVSNQYASLGVTFATGIGGYSGITPPTQTTFTTNTNMTLGGLTNGSAAPLSGNVLRTYSGWLSETADPAMTLTFSSLVSGFSIDFGANASTQTALYAYNAAGTLLGTASSVATTANGTLSLSGISGIKAVVVLPGNYNDYVSLDNLNFTPQAVPEPSALAALGIPALALLRRRKRA